MPANVALPSRAEALAAAIEGARASLEQHLRDVPHDAAPLDWSVTHDAPIAERPVLRAYRELIAAAELLKARRPLRPAKRGMPGGADTAPSPDTPTTPDDLTRIRGLDASFAERLASIGIHSFAQIAAWEPDDVPTIAHALDLGRDFVRHDVIEQAKMLLVARTANNPATQPHVDRSHGAVATWLPHECEYVALGGLPSPALTAENIDALRRELRRGIGRNTLRSLADIAPAFALAVDVPADHFDPFETEAEWRPIPLIALSNSGAGADGEPAIHLDRAGAVVAASAPPSIEAPPVAVQVSLAPPSPLHVAAAARLDELEVEIATLGTEPVAVPVAKIEPKPVPQSATPLHEPIEPAPFVVDMSPREAGISVVEADEADVTITIHRAKPLTVAALSASPLRPKRLVHADEPTTESAAAKPVPNTEVSEAAVVIVKRRAAERAAPDLEFYKVPGSSGDPGPVRRLLRAVKVL